MPQQHRTIQQNQLPGQRVQISNQTQHQAMNIQQISQQQVFLMQIILISIFFN